MRNEISGRFNPPLFTAFSLSLTDVKTGIDSYGYCRYTQSSRPLLFIGWLPYRKKRHSSTFPRICIENFLIRSSLSMHVQALIHTQIHWVCVCVLMSYFMLFKREWTISWRKKKVSNRAGWSIYQSYVGSSTQSGRQFLLPSSSGLHWLVGWVKRKKLLPPCDRKALFIHSRVSVLVKLLGWVFISDLGLFCGYYILEHGGAIKQMTTTGQKKRTGGRSKKDFRV
jgi:hypothetical protein